MVDDEDVKPRKEREPISVVCLVVLILATVGAVGAFVNDNIVNADDETVATNGSTVVVKYTGSFYNYYDEGGVIFQTSIDSIDENEDYKHSDGYSKSGDETLSVTVGSGDALSAFENSLIGMKAGETVWVKITAGDGYNAADTTGFFDNVFEVPVMQEMSASEYKALYGEDAKDGTTVTTVYGWPASVSKTADGKIVVNNLAKAGETYDIESGFATVKATVDSTLGKITYTLSLTDVTKFDEGMSPYSDFKGEDGSVAYSSIQMVKVPACGDGIGTNSFIYITGISDDGQHFEYRTVGETKNIDLYFVIEIVSVS